MNIFKILANGEGRIQETNVSAFLGYLLDPNANHSLGYEFLSTFLEPIVEDDFEARKYDYQIFFESAFSKNGKKQKVDIVIVCSKTDTGIGSESMVKKFIENAKTIEKVFLIENKILRGSITSGQLDSQYDFFKNEFIDSTPEIYSIYLTPLDKVFDNEFENTKTEKKTHIYWKDDNDLPKPSIKNMLIDILTKENNAEIEAINEYTKHTLKSFVQFIATDFKSEKAIEKERKNDGTYTQKYIDLNKNSDIKNKLINLRDELIKRNSSFNISIPNNLDKARHPELNIHTHKIILNIIAVSEKRNSVNLYYRVDKNVKNSKEIFTELGNKLVGVEGIKIPKIDSRSYFRTKKMIPKIPIDNYDEINEAINNAIVNIEEN